ncbi:MAG: universal stress protein [Lentisphaerota bacterium]
MKKLLVPIDFSYGSEPVIENAKAIAKAFNSEMRILYIIPPLPHEIRNRLEINSVSTMGDMVGRLISSESYESIRDEMASSIKTIRKKILELKNKLTAEGLSVEAYIFEGKVEESIFEEVAEYKPDMIIMSSKGHGYHFKSMFGGVYSTIIKNVTCPVLVIPSNKTTHRKLKTS